MFFISLIVLAASVVGAICGIGGGVIIKPALDLLTNLGPSTIGFFSSCTVLSMSLYSVIKEIISGTLKIDYKKMAPLAIGSIIGGFVGNMIFSYVKSLFVDSYAVTFFQSILLAFVTVLCFLYSVYKNKLSNLHIESIFISIIIGLFLGTMSSFLGIGGGPINLVVLAFFFGYDSKTAAVSSLFIILFGQTSNLLTTFIKNNTPSFEPTTLIMMIVMGILGGVIGRSIAKKFNSSKTEDLLRIAMIIIIAICLLNAYRARF